MTLVDHDMVFVFVRSWDLTHATNSLTRAGVTDAMQVSVHVQEFGRGETQHQKAEKGCRSKR